MYGSLILNLFLLYKHNFFLTSELVLPNAYLRAGYLIFLTLMTSLAFEQPPYLRCYFTDIVILYFLHLKSNTKKTAIRTYHHMKIKMP